MGDDERAAAGDLAGGVRAGALAVLVGPEVEIVVVDHDVLAELRLHIYFRDDIMPAEVVADEFLDVGWIGVQGDGQDKVFILGLGGRDVLLGGADE